MAAPILITGATGTTGSALTRLLNDRETPVRLFVRDAERASELSSSTTEVAVGDFTDTTSLASAMAGVQTVFLLTPASPDQEVWQGNVVRAAQEAGAGHIVKLSALGASPDSPVTLGRWHAATEDLIRASGMGYTFLHPHTFMQNLLANVPTIRHQGAFYGATGEAAFSAVDVRDVAAVAAAILLDPAGHQGQTYAITGPEALSHGDMAAQLGEAIGKPVQYVDLPPEAFRAGMVEAGVPPWLADALVELHKIFATGHTAEVSHVVREVTGQPGIPFSQFARDYAGAFA